MDIDVVGYVTVDCEDGLENSRVAEVALLEFCSVAIDRLDNRNSVGQLLGCVNRPTIGISVDQMSNSRISQTTIELRHNRATAFKCPNDQD